MKLMTKAIEKQAQRQYQLDAGMENSKVVAKLFHPIGSWTWYVISQDPGNPDFLCGIVKGSVVETGSFSLSELQSSCKMFGLGIERDKWFKPMPAIEVWERLQRGEHV